MTSQGTVLWVAGSTTPGLLPSCGVFCNPAGESDFAGCASLASDATGDLFCAGGAGTFAVYEVLAGPPGAGGLRHVGRFRGDGAPPALAETPDGSVIMAYRGGIVLVRPDGTTVPVTTLASALGTGDGHPNVFVGGDGLAVGGNGAVYVDTNTGNTFTTVSAIVETSTTGACPTVLWRS